ncbi:MAG: hypothetical protein FDZ69_06535 [Deltaproteobacteria bacterium]|nr:MAG: hypothetical protein FDZ69_06535 [Deltaproteobacteria bacterium]
MNIKVLAERILEGNTRGNRSETFRFSAVKPKEPESSHVCSPIQGNRETSLQRVLSEALAETDLLGRPWPSGLVGNLPIEDRSRLQKIEERIDIAVLNNDEETLAVLLIEWRSLLLDHLH